MVFPLLSIYHILKASNILLHGVPLDCLLDMRKQKLEWLIDLLKTTQLVKQQNQNLSPDLSCSKATLLIIPIPPSLPSSELFSLDTWAGRGRCCLFPGSRKVKRELGLVEINKNYPNENMQKLFIQNLLQQGSQPPSLEFGRCSKAGRGVGKLYGRKEGKASDVP